MVNNKTTIKGNREITEVADETFYRHQRYLEFIRKSLTDILKVIRKGTTKNRATKETRSCNIRFIEFAQEINDQIPSENMTEDDKISIKIILDLFYRISIALEIKSRVKLMKTLKRLAREVFILSLRSRKSWKKKLPRFLIANKHVSI
jgi:hypothetical protein